MFVSSPFGNKGLQHPERGRSWVPTFVGMTMMELKHSSCRCKTAPRKKGEGLLDRECASAPCDEVMLRYH